jgi:hypothetical protein
VSPWLAEDGVGQVEEEEHEDEDEDEDEDDEEEEGALTRNKFCSLSCKDFVGSSPSSPFPSSLTSSLGQISLSAGLDSS